MFTDFINSPLQRFVHFSYLISLHEFRNIIRVLENSVVTSRANDELLQKVNQLEESLNQEKLRITQLEGAY